MKCTKCSFDFCWQCLEAIVIGKTHPSWYECKNREQAASEGKLDKSEQERLNLNKFLSKLSMHNQHVEDCKKDRKNALALLPKIRDYECSPENNGKSLAWLRTIGEKIAESQRFLEYTWVYSYFMADSSRKETFINWQKILEEKADGMLHDLEKASVDKESFPKFFYLRPSGLRRLKKVWMCSHKKCNKCLNWQMKLHLLCSTKLIRNRTSGLVFDAIKNMMMLRKNLENELNNASVVHVVIMEISIV